MDEEVLNKLPGDLRRLAEIVGLEHTFALVEEFGGTYINIPKCDALVREIRNKQIRAEYDAGGDVRRLAIKYRLTDRQIKNILAEADEVIPLPLFNFLKPE